MQQRLDEFVRLAQQCCDPSVSLTYHQLGQLKQPKSRTRKRRGASLCVLLCWLAAFVTCLFVVFFVCVTFGGLIPSK